MVSLVAASVLLDGAMADHNTTFVVNVFDQGESGYYCIKIPALLTTQNGTLLAFGEGRRNSCGDYTWTDLVLKRSFDGGQTWGALQVVYSNSSASETNTIGNAAPVQERSSGRIVLPFCRNNLLVLVTTSSDNGATWSTPVDISANVTRSGWGWVGTGPPGSVQLSSGRLLTPAYHSYAPHDTDGEVSHSHAMYSDDGGASWQLGGELGGAALTNECQAVQLTNGTLLMNARGLLTYRLASYSYDDGASWSTPHKIAGLVEPLEGCEGSTIRHPSTGLLFFSIPNNPSVLRFNMSVFVSSDEGSSWALWRVIDTGRSGYSSLAVMPDESVVLLYERANTSGIIFVPQHISFVPKVWTPSDLARVLDLTRRQRDHRPSSGTITLAP